MSFYDVWTLGDGPDVMAHLEDEMRSSEMTKPICTCRKLPRESHAFNCSVALAVKRCQSPRCNRRATFVGYHANLTPGHYCMQDKNRLIAEGVLIEDTVEHI